MGACCDGGVGWEGGGEGAMGRGEGGGEEALGEGEIRGQQEGSTGRGQGRVGGGDISFQGTHDPAPSLKPLGSPPTSCTLDVRS